MKNIYIAILVIGVLGFITPTTSFSHPGRTDSTGCHTCKTNCPNWGLSSGEYHCHTAKALPQPEEPIKSTFGENGTGYTTPAPEYKVPKAITPKPAEQKPAPIVAPKKIETQQEEIKAEASTSVPVQAPAPVKKRNWLWRLLFGF
jgi:hypothetical protein